MDPSLIEYSSPRARSRFIKRKKDTITSITRGWATIDSPHHTRLSEPPIIEAARPLIGEARLLFPRLRGRVKTNEWSRNRSSQGRKEFESKTSAFLPYVSFEHFRLVVLTTLSTEGEVIGLHSDQVVTGTPLKGMCRENRPEQLEPRDFSSFFLILFLLLLVYRPGK